MVCCHTKEREKIHPTYLWKHKLDMFQGIHELLASPKFQQLQILCHPLGWLQFQCLLHDSEFLLKNHGRSFLCRRFPLLLLELMACVQKESYDFSALVIIIATKISKYKLRTTLLGDAECGKYIIFFLLRCDVVLSLTRNPAKFPWNVGCGTEMWYILLQAIILYVIFVSRKLFDIN